MISLYLCQHPQITSLLETKDFISNPVCWSSEPQKTKAKTKIYTHCTPCQLWFTDRITVPLSFLQEHPVVITKFIRGAREVEVDAVAKGGKVRHNWHVAKEKLDLNAMVQRFIQCTHLENNIICPSFIYIKTPFDHILIYNSIIVMHMCSLALFSPQLFFTLNGEVGQILSTADA